MPVIVQKLWEMFIQKNILQSYAKTLSELRDSTILNYMLQR